MLKLPKWEPSGDAFVQYNDNTTPQYRHKEKGSGQMASLIVFSLIYYNIARIFKVFNHLMAVWCNLS